jgi:hypothetical protein
VACAAAVATIQVGAWAVVNLGHLFGVLGLLVESKGNGWEWGFAALFFSMQLAHARQSREQGPGMSLPRVWRHSATCGCGSGKSAALLQQYGYHCFQLVLLLCAFSFHGNPKSPPPRVTTHSSVKSLQRSQSGGKASPTRHPKTLVSIVACYTPFLPSCRR